MDHDIRTALDIYGPARYAKIADAMVYELWGDPEEAYLATLDLVAAHLTLICENRCDSCIRTRELERRLEEARR